MPLPLVLAAILASPTAPSRSTAPTPRAPPAKSAAERRPVAAHVLTGLAVFRGAVTSAFAVSGYVLRIDERWQDAQERFEDDPWLSFDILPDAGAVLAYVGGFPSHAVTLGLSGTAGAFAGRDDRRAGRVPSPAMARRRIAGGTTLLVTGVLLHAFAPFVMETACAPPEAESDLDAHRRCLQRAAGFAATMAVIGTATSSAGAGLLGHVHQATRRTQVNVSASRHGGGISFGLRF